MAWRAVAPGGTPSVGGGGCGGGGGPPRGGTPRPPPPHPGRPPPRWPHRRRGADRPSRSLQRPLDPGREALDRRIDAACLRMLEAGLLREVRGLCERGYGPELPPMQAIGYRHLLPVVQGADTLRNALAAMQRDTRRFARRQRTWLRGVPEARWFDTAAREAIFAAASEFLKGAEPPGATPCR